MWDMGVTELTGMDIVVKIELINNNCMPIKKHEYDAGYDLKATEGITLMFHEEYLFDTGVRFAIPPGYCGMVFPRSGLGNKGAVLKNTVGIIDSDYRGNIFVNVKNVDERPLTISKFERFAQIVIVPVLLAKLKVVDKLPLTDRGVGGFGSTGAE